MSVLATTEWEYWTGAVGMAGVVITLAAVVVALFGPGWRASTRRPKISITANDAEHEWWNAESHDDYTEGFLELAAAKGRDTAEGVEVFLSLARAPVIKDRGPMRAFQARRLCFDSFHESEDGEPRSNAPPGFVRRIPWVAVGHYRTLWNLVPKGDWPPGAPEEEEAYEDDCALLNLHRRSKRNVVAMDTMFGGRHHVYITVTGTNFDAVSYGGVVDVSRGSYPVEPDVDRSPPIFFAKLTWVHALAPRSTPPDWLTN